MLNTLSYKTNVTVMKYGFRIPQKKLTADFEEKLQEWYKNQVVLFLRWGYFVMDSKKYWLHLTAFTYSTEYKLLIILSPTVQKKFHPGLLIKALGHFTK